MTVLPGICYCDATDSMSKCKAKKIGVQKHCQFFDESVCSPRCMYYIMDEYCDCWQAYDFFKLYGVITREMYDASLTERRERAPEKLRITHERIDDLLDVAKKAQPVSCDYCLSFHRCFPTGNYLHKYPWGTRQGMAKACTKYTYNGGMKTLTCMNCVNLTACNPSPTYDWVRRAKTCIDFRT